MVSTNATSLWACNAIGFALFLLRLGLRTWRKERWNQGDYWTISAGLFMIVRVTVSHYILMYGTTTTLSAAQREAHDFTDEELYWLTTNSKLNLLSRFVLNGLLWSLKLVVLDFLRRIIRKLHFERLITVLYLAVIAITWAVATVNIFIECRPFHRWWQIYPDPGPCVQGNLWLLTYEIGNMLTDAMLLALPFPLLFRAKVSWGKRLRLSAVFSLGFFLIAVSIVRIVQGLTKSRIQLSRTMWASVETLFACIAACGPSIYCLIRKGREGSSFDPSSGHSNSRSSKAYTSGGTGSRSRTQHSVLRSRDAGDFVGGGIGGHGAVHFDPSSNGRTNFHGREGVTMWTDVNNPDEHELDTLKRDVIAEDASTKGILVATTLHQVHEFESNERRGSGET
ncbi:hypothetical protein ABW19_dt0201120 [Dactylella cylindrospora]|nr:hypothetical protein ABW19_dt0201120 [Dactylella cylindrospora]